MPKRPCAITLTHDDETILCGDKFGDVYALPLHQAEEEPQPEETAQAKASSNWRKDKTVSDTNGNSSEDKQDVFKPSATELTVHSGRNLRALQEQLRVGKQPKKAKPAVAFSHEIILGHVSMLTDIASVRIGVDEAGRAMKVPRDYILTADRDEHIRVSRGQPQAHIIENFCFGHTQFVSKLCLPQPEILVSGGGEDYLFIWNWRDGQLLRKIDLRGPLKKYWEAQSKTSVSDSKGAGASSNNDAEMLQDSAGTRGDVQEPDAAQDFEDETSEEVPENAPIAVKGIFARAEPRIQNFKDPVFWKTLKSHQVVLT